MKINSLKNNLMMLGLIAISFVAVAKTISINAGTGVFLGVPAARGIGTGDIADLRIAALTALTGMYRATYGVGSVSIGDVIAVTYQNGSRERGQVLCMAGSVCVTPMPGTQVGAGGGGGGDGHPGGGSLSGGGSGVGVGNSGTAGGAGGGKVKVGPQPT